MAKVESRGLTKAQMKEKIRERYKGVSLDEAEVIPARKQRDFYDTDEHQRVAVYVRVSTDNIQQTSSYELQKNYYEDMVNRHDSGKPSKPTTSGMWKPKWPYRTSSPNSQ